MMAPSKAPDGLATMRTTISLTVSLLHSFQLALQSPTLPHSDIENPPQPLALLSDSCKILKAQTTKLSLLILNKPFTPSAITYILNACTSGCLPAMMSALQLCPAETFTSLLHLHIKTSLSRIMTELLNLLASIPQDERGIEPQSRDTLASTGVLWAECDKMVTLAFDGLVALAVQKAADYHSLLKDAIAELEEWDPEEEDSDSDTDSILSTKQKTARTSAIDTTPLASSFENLSVAPIIELRKRSLAILCIARVLYPALQKRRISTFPNITSSSPLETLPSSPNIQRLDSMILCTQQFTEDADEIAGALYESDEEQVLRRLGELREGATQCATRAKRNWKGEEDEFAGWVDKWITRLREVAEE